MLPSGTSRLVKQAYGHPVGARAPGLLLVNALPECDPVAVLDKSRGFQGRLQEAAVIDVLLFLCVHMCLLVLLFVCLGKESELPQKWSGSRNGADAQRSYDGPPFKKIEAAFVGDEKGGNACANRTGPGFDEIAKSGSLKADFGANGGAEIFSD